MHHWPKKKVEDIATPVGGGTPGRKSPAYWGPGIPWFTVADLSDDLRPQPLTKSREDITRLGLNNSAAKLIPKGAVVFSVRVVVGKVGIAQNDIATNQDFISLVPKPIIDAEYLSYALLQLRSTIRRNQQGATIRGIRKTHLLSIEISVPPLMEQRRIVTRIKECLDRADEIRQLRVESKNEIDIYISAVIEDILAGCIGDTVPLSDVCEITGNLVDPKEKQYQKLLHIGGANIVSKTGDIINLKTAEEEKLTSGKHLFTEDDCIYSKIRPYLQKVAKPDFSGLCSADMYPLRPKKDKLLRDFLFFLLLSRDFTSYANSISNRAGIPKINRKQLFSYKFTLPTLEQQSKVVEKLNNAFRYGKMLNSEINQSNSEIGSLQNSILHRAFSGEL